MPSLYEFEWMALDRERQIQADLKFARLRDRVERGPRLPRIDWSRARRLLRAPQRPVAEAPAVPRLQA